MTFERNSDTNSMGGGIGKRAADDLNIYLFGNLRQKKNHSLVELLISENHHNCIYKVVTQLQSCGTWS